jgi:hypothetical protein
MQMSTFFWRESNGGKMKSAKCRRTRKRLHFVRDDPAAVAEVLADVVCRNGPIRGLAATAGFGLAAAAI